MLQIFNPIAFHSRFRDFQASIPLLLLSIKLGMTEMEAARPSSYGEPLFMPLQSLLPFLSCQYSPWNQEG